MYKTDNGYIEGLLVSECRPLLRRELRNAYQIQATVNTKDGQRIISYSPAQHAPSTKLPWPLSKLAMHDVGIVYYAAKGEFTKANGEINGKRFTKDQIDTAIEEFLSGVPVTERVTISVENS
jgi:hypothetical protein